MAGQSKRLCISIVSFCDSELVPTIHNALSQARYPENITISLVEQDFASNYENLKEVVEGYGANLSYKYFSVEESQGVVWARWWAAKELLNNDYGYYLQIDSHSRFLRHYDSFLISSYNNAYDYWGRFVWTGYCPSYDIENGEYILHYAPVQSTFGIVQKQLPSVIVGCIKPANIYDNVYGEPSYQVSGHFLFGEASIFIENPFDPFLFWEGEESTYAARLYCNNILTVSPPANYIWHKYESGQEITTTRKKHSPFEKWHKADFMVDKLLYLHSRGIDRCKQFWNNEISDVYGASSSEKLEEFLSATIRQIPEYYSPIGFDIKDLEL